MATKRKPAAKKKPAARKKPGATKRPVSTKRKAATKRKTVTRRSVALDTALMMGGEMPFVPATPLPKSKRKTAAKLKRKGTAKRSLGQRIRRFVEKQLG